MAERDSKMGLYFPGMNEALDKVEKMDRDELKRHLSNLYGFDDLPSNPDGNSDDELREEAKRQTVREFTNTRDPEWEYINALKGRRP
jgi:hypothetical protein